MLIILLYSLKSPCCGLSPFIRTQYALSCCDLSSRFQRPRYTVTMTQSLLEMLPGLRYRSLLRCNHFGGIWKTNRILLTQNPDASSKHVVKTHCIRRLLEWVWPTLWRCFLASADTMISIPAVNVGIGKYCHRSHKLAIGMHPIIYDYLFTLDKFPRPLLFSLCLQKMLGLVNVTPFSWSSKEYVP